MSDWEWDETLYEGSAAHYQTGRLPYPPELPNELAKVIDLHGRLLDIGCGPGKFTIPLAPWFDEAIGVDADPGMIAEARKAAPQLRWIVARAEELPELGRFEIVSFAQSFHWMDPAWVRDHLRGLVEGAVLHVAASTHDGAMVDDRPHPPYDRITQLVRAYLGPGRRAGRRTLTTDHIRDDEDLVLRQAGFTKEQVVEVHAGRVWERSEREVASAVLSLSSSTPALFGDRFPDFERDLGDLLRRTSDDGWFAERQTDMSVTVWR